MARRRHFHIIRLGESSDATGVRAAKQQLSDMLCSRGYGNVAIQAHTSSKELRVPCDDSRDVAFSAVIDACLPIALSRANISGTRLRRTAADNSYGLDPRTSSELEVLREENRELTALSAELLQQVESIGSGVSCTATISSSEPSVSTDALRRLEERVAETERLIEGFRGTAQVHREEKKAAEDELSEKSRLYENLQRALTRNRKELNVVQGLIASSLDLSSERIKETKQLVPSADHYQSLLFQAAHKLITFSPLLEAARSFRDAKGKLLPGYVPEIPLIAHVSRAVRDGEEEGFALAEKFTIFMFYPQKIQGFVMSVGMD